MTVYFYKATDKNGKFVEGDIEAPDHRVAVQLIQRLNYFPIQVSEENSGRGIFGDWKLPGREVFNRVSTKELLNITQQLATLIDSGLTLDSSLSSLAQLAEKDKTREVLSAVQKRVHAGSSFAEALSEHPQVFSKLYINMIRAGEAGGTLTTSLTRMASFMEKSEELKNNVRSAMVYPAILTLVGGSAVVVLITVVIPQFSKLFEEMGQALPLPTQIMLAISSVIRDYWGLILILLVTAAVGFVLYLKNENGRYQWDKLILHLPLFGPLVRKIEVSRFSLTTSTLIKSGVPLLQALDIVQSILSNRVIVSAMGPIQKGLKGGQGFSGPLRQSGVFPPLAIHMITVGETSGALDEMLARVSETYDREVELSIKQIISLIEPFMILFMAMVIGFIVISMLLAIFSVNEISF
ncbi:MAG: type II secretion system F family protein [Nitrospinaceae bacterium]